MDSQASKPNSPDTLKLYADHDFIKKVADTSPAMIAVYNIRSGEYVYVNKAIEKILGYQPNDFMEGGIAFASSLLHPEDIESIMTKNRAALERANSENIPEHESIVNFEYRMKHKDGNYRWLHSDGSVFARDEDGKVEFVLNISVDITARKEAEGTLERLKAQLEEQVLLRTGELTKAMARLTAIVDYSFDAILTKNLEGVITSWNKGAERIYGYTADEAMGKPVSILLPPEKNDEFPDIMDKLRAGEYIDHFETERVRKDGKIINVSLTISPVRDANNNIVGASTIARDITERRLAEEQIRHHYYHDVLTGLPNRTWFKDQLAIETKQKQKFSILLIDLDRFKLINESLGHPIGDRLIKEAGLRIQSCLTPACKFARFGGDEFAIIYSELGSDSHVKNLANKLLATFRHPFVFDEQQIYISPSMGISFYPGDATEPADLIQCAEIALYHAKEEGKNNYQFYNDNMSIVAGYHVNLESNLHRAIDNELFVVYYQPQVNIRTGEILEVEALVRAQDEQMRLTLPDNFIPLAEITGLIEPLGELVLKSACKQVKIWNDRGFPDLRVAVNISSRQFKQKEFIKTVERIIDEAKIKPSNLELELTERVLLEGSQAILRNMRHMAKLGIRFSLDDFSMGYSSLNYIQKFPLNVLKIDRTFLKGIPANKANCAIAKSIVNLGHNLGMMVVAEGVETLEQLQFLYDNQCDKVQGFIFNAAVPGDSISEILGEGRYANIINKIRNPTLPFTFAYNKNP